MRLTAILRDIKQDYKRGRIYIPLEDMVRFGYTEGDLSRAVLNDRLRNLIRFEIEQTRSLYQSGAEYLCWLASDRSRIAAASIIMLHSGILTAIERRNYDIFHSRIVLSPLQKLRPLLAAWRLARRKSSQPLPPLFLV
jgi:15-cis-phytoene synthase